MLSPVSGSVEPPVASVTAAATVATVLLICVCAVVCVVPIDADASCSAALVAVPAIGRAPIELINALAAGSGDAEELLESPPPDICTT